MLLVLSGKAAAKSDEDLTSLRGIRWGMTVTDAITLFGRSVLVQQTKTLLLGCFVQHAIPIELLDEEWFIWLCEAPEKSVVAALNFETANRHTEHFNELLEAFVNAYGPAHSYWHTCHNVNWNKTVQYDWYFPELKISLVDRDEPAKWVVMRYEPPSPTKSNTVPASVLNRRLICGETQRQVSRILVCSSLIPPSPMFWRLRRQRFSPPRPSYLSP